MNKTWYNITHAAEGSTEAEVSIYDAIGGYDINAKDFANDLKEIDAETIHLRINSPGGCVIDGNAICNALQRHSAKVITHIDGLAASMASVVAMAGDEVHMADNALLMIHNPWTVTIGDADELRADADLLDKMSANILASYGRSQYEAEELKELMDAETWFTAQEALDAGFIDHIEGGLRAAASDIKALAEGSELTIPADKQIVSLNKQLEAVTKASAAISEELAEQVTQFNDLAHELSAVQAELETAQAEKISADETNQALSEEIKEMNAELEAKDAEIEEVKEITEATVASKAAEIIQLATVEPVGESCDDSDSPLSDEEFWAEYKRIGDEHGLNAKNVWYAENKHRKI